MPNVPGEIGTIILALDVSIMTNNDGKHTGELGDNIADGVCWVFCSLVWVDKLSYAWSHDYKRWEFVKFRHLLANTAKPSQQQWQPGAGGQDICAASHWLDGRGEERLRGDRVHEAGHIPPPGSTWS